MSRIAINEMYSMRCIQYISHCVLTFRCDFLSCVGTNNARLGGMLRQLAMYYHKDANNLFMVRLAQVKPLLLFVS